MYVYMCTCMFVCMYVCMCLHMYYVQNFRKGVFRKDMKPYVEIFLKFLLELRMHVSYMCICINGSA